MRQDAIWLLDAPEADEEDIVPNSHPEMRSHLVAPPDSFERDVPVAA